MLLFRKTSVLIIFSCIALKVFSQENQSVLAAKWNNGEYDCYTQKSQGDFKWIKNEKQAKVRIDKNSANKIQKIFLLNLSNDGDFKHLDSTSTEFVRHYTNTLYNLNNLYFTENSIVAYSFKTLYPNLDIEIKECIGKKTNEKIKEEILDYLEKTKSYFVPTKINDASEIESVTAKIISKNNPPVTNSYVEIGLIVKTKWGIETKSKILGGRLDDYNFTTASNQLEQSIVSGVTFWKIDCKNISNNEIVIRTILNKAPEKVHQTIVPITCEADNSPIRTLSKLLNEYDYIRYSVLENGKSVIKKLKKIQESGYTTYKDNLIEILEKKNSKSDLILVSKNNKIGYIEPTGKLIIPIEYEDGNVDNFTSGLIGVMKEGKCGFLNFQNKIAIPFNYDMVWNFNGGMAMVKSNQKYGFVNQLGNEVVKPFYDKAWSLSYGAALIQKDTKYGYIDANGAIIANTIYDDAFNFDKWGFATVSSNGKFGSIDKTGKIVIPIEQEKYPTALNKDLFAIYKIGKFGIVNKTGKVLFDYKYDEIYNCGTSNKKDESDQIIKVRIESYYGFVKTDGKVLKDCIYLTAGDFVNGTASIHSYNTDTYISKKGSLTTSGQENWTETTDTKSEYSTTTKSESKPATNVVSDKKTIKNTGKNPLYIRAGKGASSSINGGSSYTVPCRQDIYYCNDDGHGNHTVTGKLISGANQDCGQTVNAVGGN